MNTDIKVVEVEPRITEEFLRTPLKFAFAVVDRVSRLVVKVTVENRTGDRATGHGDILLSDLWGFPSRVVEHPERDAAMREVGTRYARAVVEYGQHAHPLDYYFDLHETLDLIRAEVCKEMALAEHMPMLGALVCASPTDAAVHDAFGNVNGIDTYDGFGQDMCKDMGHYIGRGYEGRYLSEFLSPSYAPRMPIFHLVGGVDKLTRAELDDTDPDDGMPVSLDQWIEQDGLYCFKIKLKGTELDWDVERIVTVSRICDEVLTKMGRKEGYCTSVDSNELCPDPEYVVEMLHKVREQSPQAYDALAYVEQPTERDISAHKFKQHEVAKLKPVVADEGVTDMESFDLAKELGWSGIALKTCKGLSSALLYQARCKHEGLIYTVQDLTLPGISFIHSAGFAGRIDPLKGVEYNSRQYLPKSSDPERAVHEPLFKVVDGEVSLETLSGTGLATRAAEWDAF